MATLNEKISQLSSTNDTKKKLVIGQEIIDYLGQPENPVECDDLGGFIDMLVPFMQSSNFKVSQNGLDIVGLLIERMGHSFRPYVNTVMPAAIDRLGDTRETVREKAGFLVSKLLEEDVLEPQILFEKNISAFSHKNGKVREEILILLQNTLNIYGAQSLIVTKFLASIVALLSDPTASVRDAAFSTLVEIYTHIGERLRIDLQRKHQVPPAKLPILMSKFDAARANGEMKPTATLGMGTTDGNNRGDDETDRQSIKSASSSKSRSSSVPAGRRQVFAAPKPPSAGGGGTTNVENGNSSRGHNASSVRRNPSMRLGSSSSAGQAGAVDEESFILAFEEVSKKVTIFNGRSVADELNKIKDTLAKTSNDWKVRIEALQMMRALLMAGADQYDEMMQALRTLEVPFQSSVKDLRSQVVREACITIGYMSQQLRHRVDRFLEALMQNIISLIPNSAKVMSSSGIVCMRFIIQNTYSARFIPIITSNVSSKSKEIRKHCCEFIQQLLHTWPTHALEKHKDILQESIKKGISDADPDARVFARKAYWGFADHFKDQADTLLNSLDPNHRRMLQSSGVSGNMSNSSSSNSLNLTGRNVSSTLSGTNSHAGPGHASSASNVFSARSRQSSVTSSKENLLDGDASRKTQTLTRKHSGIPMYSSPTKAEASPNTFLNNGSPRQTPPARSNSAIDASAVRRASVRAQYAHRHRLGALQGAGGIGASLPRPRKSSDGKMGFTQSPVTPNNAIRNGGRSRSSITHSQPGSRSTSPTSLSSYATYFGSGSGQPTSMGVTPRSRRTSSGIPRSTGPSRETSPNRYSGGYGQRRIGTGRSGITPDRPPKRPQMTEKILKQSLEAETAIADALKSSPRKNSRTNSHGLFDDGDRSDESETSSICSERSYPDFGRRSSDGFGIRGGDSRERLLWDPVNQDIGEIIANCASTHWADRKDGLIGLQCYFRDGRMLTGSELRRVTDIFARMFMDAHTKVFTLFLDSLIELVVTHKEDLRDWLHTLITRLLNKLGADLLGSIVQKIYRTLDVIKESFPLPDQLTVLMRFLVDQAITPNVKVKVATMKHVTNISQTMASLSLSQGVQTGLLISDSDEQMALAKVITWTYEPKSPEVRKHSQAALISLFQLNSSHYGRILSKLPKSFQDNATPLVSSHLMNESTATLTPTDSSGSPTTDSGDTLPTLKSTIIPSMYDQGKSSTVQDSLLDSSLILSTGPSPMKPRSLHPTNSIEGGHMPNKKNIPGSREILDPSDDAENLNPEEIHHSLNDTAKAIQNYSFDPDVKGDKYSSSSLRGINIPIVREPKEDKCPGEMSSTNGDGNGDHKNAAINAIDPTALLEQEMSRLDINGSKFANGNQAQVNKNNLENLARGNYHSLPRNMSSIGSTWDKWQRRSNSRASSVTGKKSASLPERKREESRLAINDIIEELQNIKNQSRSNERKACMTQLIRMSRDGQITVIQDNFRTLLRLLLENLADDIGATRALVFGVLTEMLKQEQLISCFQGYTELIILKVLESHRDTEKDVERAAEGCAAAMAGVLPADKVIQVLNPIIKTGDYPVNQAAVKMLTKVAEHESSKEVVSNQLGCIMPGLLKAYDNVESSVRKASVFCMVALHQLVGENLQPHLSCLNGSKLKLLNLYIKRAQAQSTPASPRLTTPP